jgi:hypothetical protein
MESSSCIAVRGSLGAHPDAGERSRYAVTVEGVETREQFGRLKSLGVNFAQV